MNDQIERLKENRVPWKWLPKEDREVFQLNSTRIVILGPNDVWYKKQHDKFFPNEIYRIYKEEQK